MLIKVLRLRALIFFSPSVQCKARAAVQLALYQSSHSGKWMKEWKHIVLRSVIFCLKPSRPSNIWGDEYQTRGKRSDTCNTNAALFGRQESWMISACVQPPHCHRQPFAVVLETGAGLQCHLFMVTVFSLRQSGLNLLCYHNISISREVEENQWNRWIGLDALIR